MYLPPQFKEDRIDVLHETIRARGLGTLVALARGEMIASHVPMLIDPAPAPYGTLIGHVSRGNPQGRAVDGAVETLAIFLGAEAYVTPSWYATKRETGKVVPTWNYAVVHAYGRMTVIQDEAWLKTQIEDLTRFNEAARAEPWAVTDAPAPFVDAMVRGIVGLSIEIARIEGKWKVSQNRLPIDREGAAAGLRATGEAEAGAMADLIAGTAARTGLAR